MSPTLLPALALFAAPQDTPPDPLATPAARTVPAQQTPPDRQTTPAAAPEKLPQPARAVATAPAATVATPTQRHSPGDPLEHLNRRFYRSHESFDRRFFRPAAMGYKHAVPAPVRSGLRNFFSNLNEPIVFLNYVLQLKPGKAAETLGRFVINSTLGIGGVLDVARQPNIHLPHRPNSFGDTLGYYGVKPGPYLFLPFVGPTTLRDILSGPVDGLVLPTAVGHPFDRWEWQVSKGVVTGLDARAEADEELQALLGTAVDPYATLRSVYLQNRAGEIAQLHGRRRTTAAAPGAELSDPLADPGTGATSSAPPSAAPELQDPLADPAVSTTTPAPAHEPAPSAAPEPSNPRADPAGAHAP